MATVTTTLHPPTIKFDETTLQEPPRNFRRGSGISSRRSSIASSRSGHSTTEDHAQDWSLTTDEKDTWATRERRRSSVWSKIDTNAPTTHFNNLENDKRRGSVLSIWKSSKDSKGRDILLHDDHEYAVDDTPEETLVMPKSPGKRKGSRADRLSRGSQGSRGQDRRANEGLPRIYWVEESAVKLPALVPEIGKAKEAFTNFNLKLTHPPGALLSNLKRCQKLPNSLICRTSTWYILPNRLRNLNHPLTGVKCTRRRRLQLPCVDAGGYEVTSCLSTLHSIHYTPTLNDRGIISLEFKIQKLESSMETKTEVFICGSGSAGLAAATWLSLHHIPYKIVDLRSGPLERGQADGVQCRTVEIFESFSLFEELLREGYHVLELAFWQEEEDEGGKSKGIMRKRSAPDTVQGLSHCPHVILNQARMNGLLLGKMKECNGDNVEYGHKVVDVAVDEKKAEDPDAYCVTVRTEKDGKVESCKAKYVLISKACDGAHSAVRHSLGFKMIGDTSDSVWGVMDIYPRTNFPDIRKKVVLHSSHGSLMIIPREGGSLARFYIEIPRALTPKMSPFPTYTKPLKKSSCHIKWNSQTHIGGDACHTHSPKAGQGMNVSLQDGYNIGWKLASILTGHASASLLKTYNIEREKVASNLIDFDRTWAKQMSSKGFAHVAKEDFSETFVKAGRFTAGLTSTYDDSVITRKKWSDQGLASNLVVGMRVPSTLVVRFCDAKAMQFVKAFPSDGRWRIAVFAGDVRNESSKEKLKKLGDYLFSKEDLHKIYIDDESYNSGYGDAYQFYGVDAAKGAVVIVRPDQHVALVVDVENHELISDLFSGFAVPQRS
ncbi:hypothetical protein G7Y89_g10976 [Cudoniella acicularis]|uniref:Phenol 2-monooxygenase n=1 Tax=Cudoniella acicularis TaxID=354080 RepID=A0A8H4VY94_9HELO|nr:hypothetical protein G7Y89_g10976 [Cudoniella acicularis]